MTTIIVNLSSILFFIVVQTLFFVYIASKQLDNIVLEKTSILLSLWKALVHNGFTKIVPIMDRLVAGVGNAESIPALSDQVISQDWIAALGVAIPAPFDQVIKDWIAALGPGKVNIDIQKRERTKANMKLLATRVLPLIGALTLLIIILLILNVYGKNFSKWNRADTFGLGLIPLSYVTEILFFVLLVRGFILVPDTILWSRS